MAYVTQEMKKEIAPKVKEILKANGLKGSLKIYHHLTLVLTIKSGSIDFISNYNETAAKKYSGPFDFTPAQDHIGVNEFHVNKSFSSKAAEVIEKLIKALKGPDFFDHSDSMTDYFHCSHYIKINIGDYDKPYELVA
jgi:hypothetical protein